MSDKYIIIIHQTKIKFTKRDKMQSWLPAFRIEIVDSTKIRFVSIETEHVPAEPSTVSREAMQGTGETCSISEEWIQIAEEKCSVAGERMQEAEETVHVSEGTEHSPREKEYVIRETMNEATGTLRIPGETMQISRETVFMMQKRCVKPIW